jgi:sodium/hydrogen antiporter
MNSIQSQRLAPAMEDLFAPPKPYISAVVGGGFLILLVAWLPLLVKRLPLSLPILCILLGAGFFLTPWPVLGLLPGPAPHPLEYPTFTERLAEFVVIISLMGAGLKIDTRFSFRRWGISWRLLAITMPISIAAIALLGLWGGLPAAAAILLAASLAPTDPVLASDVQVGPPRSGEEDEVRFALTSEAGLNDGLAFPFVNLAIALAVSGLAPEDWLQDWLLVDVGWKLAIGLLGGLAVGRLLGWLTFHLPGGSALARSGDGVLAIAATFLAYGLTEMLHGYGFLAVFVAALSLRHAHRSHEFQEDLHDLAEQVERIAMAFVLVLFGGAAMTGLFDALQPIDYAIAGLTVLVVRPVAGLIGLAGLPLSRGERLAIAFFGIRGIGTIYYLAYGLNNADFADSERLWAIAGAIILLSILLHGLTVTPVMDWLDRRRSQRWRSRS